MLPASVWFSSFAPASQATRVLDALRAAGVRLLPYDTGEANGPGLLLFERVAPPVCDFVRSASRNGLDRVLAVGTSRQALADEGPWPLLASGASDVFAWDHSACPVDEVTARLERWKAVDRLVDSPLVRRNLVGASPVWTTLLRRVVEVASFTQSPVLLTGESGTGKELVARLIHGLDPRPRKRELVVLDCTTIVPELSGSEFFGHERGAYTGAAGSREGAFALSDGGTLFLDEVGELPPGMQAQLLRAVQERSYKRVGGNQWQKTDFRLVSATNRRLEEEVHAGRFRADLFYRIASVVVRLPPLRERPEDVIPLFEHFFADITGSDDVPALDDAVRASVLRRDYPGNVRDLRQLAARLACRHVGPGPITAGDLPEDERPTVELADATWQDGAFEGAVRTALARGVGLREIGRATADAAIRTALQVSDHNVQRAARLLGVTARALQLRRAGSRGAAAGDGLEDADP